MSYPDVLPHDPPKKIADDLFVVHGCVRVSAMVRFTRNMVVVREAGELTLINPVRMDDAGLAALEALGTVAHVLRLGPLHGMDDPFYVDRYKTTFWSFTDGTNYTVPAITHPLTEGCALPFSSARLFAFGHMKQTEGVILLERSANILLTCDGIQSYTSPPHKPNTNWLSRMMMPFIGFPNETIIGPIWMKLLVTDKEGMKAEFERLLEWEFEQLIAAHGTFLETGAHAALERAFKKMF